jgi:diacylglycerol kinase (ATP)
MGCWGTDNRQRLRCGSGVLGCGPNRVGRIKHVRCVLIYNPIAGIARNGRQEQLRQVREVLLSAGHEVEITATTGADSASGQTREAVKSGADVVFACGGDGTVHQVIQGLITDTGEPTAILGVIPLGSANALARHLRLSVDPAKAALEQINGSPRMIPAGRLLFGEQTRYFVVMAGAGPDGALVYRMLRGGKGGIGRFAYYLHAGILFATQRFRMFKIEYVEADSGKAFSQKAVSAMAVRVDDLGGLFSRLTSRQASVEQTDLHLHILRPPALLSLPCWFISGWLGLNRLNPFLKTVSVTSFCCVACSEPAPHFQTDGEWVGGIPMRVSMVPDALRILIPSGAGRKQG